MIQTGLRCPAARHASGRTSGGRPDFFIVGAPKCGTSALAHYLGAHPDIFMARKEMHAFGSDLQFGPQFYRRDQAAYLAEFAARTGQSRAGEASVWYLFSSRAAEELRAFSPEASIILLLRDPVEMLPSLYNQFRYDGNEHLPTFEEALAAEEERRAGRQISRRAYFPQGLLYRAAARYTEQVRRYFHVFGRYRVQVHLFEEFVADPAAAYQRTLEFLEVDSSRVDTAFKVINGAQSTRSPALRSLLEEPWLRRTALAVRPWLPRTLFSRLQRTEAWLRRANSQRLKRPPLSPALRAQLRSEFAPEVERLSELLERELTAWTT